MWVLTVQQHLEIHTHTHIRARAHTQRHMSDEKMRRQKFPAAAAQNEEKVSDGTQSSLLNVCIHIYICTCVFMLAPATDIIISTRWCRCVTAAACIEQVYPHPGGKIIRLPESMGRAPGIVLEELRTCLGAVMRIGDVPS